MYRESDTFLFGESIGNFGIKKKDDRRARTGPPGHLIVSVVGRRIELLLRD